MSVFESSLIKASKASYGTGASGPASIAGWPFTIDPTSVQLPIRAKMQKFRTVGGFVVQIYGTTWGDLTVSGQFGGLKGTTGGWRAQRDFLEQMMQIAQQQSMQRPARYAGQNFQPSQPFLFRYPLLNWEFFCYLKNYSSPDGPMAVNMTNENINPKWTLTLFIVTDNNSLTEVTKQAYLQRLAPGLGVMWNTSTESYQGYADDQYNAPLTASEVGAYVTQDYVNSPTGGGGYDVIPAMPSNTVGPDTTPAPPGSTPSGSLNINTPTDFANALIAALPITPVNTTITVNLIRAWQCQEGMWKASWFDANPSDYPGGSKAWTAPYMNNPLNVGGAVTGVSNGQKGTYNSYPITYLLGTGTGVTYSFGGNWTAGVDSTAYAMHQNASWHPIITALADSSPTEFFTAVEQWNAGMSNYSSEMQTKYDSPNGPNGYLTAGY